jgi:hypothetical protein
LVNLQHYFYHSPLSAYVAGSDGLPALGQLPTRKPTQKPTVSIKQRKSAQALNDLKFDALMNGRSLKKEQQQQQHNEETNEVFEAAAAIDKNSKRVRKSLSARIIPTRAPTVALWANPPWLSNPVPTMAPTPYFMNPINSFLEQGIESYEKAEPEKVVYPSWLRALQTPAPTQQPTHFAANALDKFLLPAEQVALSMKTQTQWRQPTHSDKHSLEDYFLKRGEESAESVAANLDFSQPTKGPTVNFMQLRRIPAAQRGAYLTPERIKEEHEAQLEGSFNPSNSKQEQPTEQPSYRAAREQHTERTLAGAKPAFSMKILSLLHGIHQKKHAH